MSEVEPGQLVRNARALVGAAGDDHPHRRGMAQAASGSYAAAITSFREAIAAAPDAPWSYVALAQVLVATGARTEAAETFRLALERAPENAVALRESIAVELIGVDDPATAVTVLRDVLVREPQRPGAVVALARALLAHADALREEAARLLVDVGDLPLDESLLAAAIDAAPRVPGLYARLAETLADRGDRARALTVVQVGLAHDPEDPATLLVLADLLADDEPGADRLSDDQRARMIELVEVAVAANPDDRDLLLRRARLAERGGSGARAIEAWRALTAVEPDVAEWHRRLGDCLARHGDFEAAGEEYDRAVALGYVVY